jgi:ribonuclease BN (tRNA processing enzyme)
VFEGSLEEQELHVLQNHPTPEKVFKVLKATGIPDVIFFHSSFKTSNSQESRGLRSGEYGGSAGSLM